MLTKAQVRTLVRAYLTDAEKQVWSDTNIDVVIQTTMDEIWGEILDEAPWFRSQKDNLGTANLVSPGYIDLSGSGPLSKRFYRVQRFTRNSQEYGVAHPHDSVTFGSSNSDISSHRFTYFVSGAQLWAFPLDMNCPIELRYSYLPTAFTTASDSDQIDWIEGFENALVYDSVLRMIDDQARLMKYSALQTKALDRLKSRVRREYVGPAVMFVSDSVLEWSGT